MSKQKKKKLISKIQKEDCYINRKVENSFSDESTFDFEN